MAARMGLALVLIASIPSSSQQAYPWMLLHQCSHQTHHLVTVQMGELTDVSVRQAGFSPLRTLLKRLQHLRFRCLPFTPTIAFRLT